MEERNPGIFRASCLYFIACLGLWFISLAAGLISRRVGSVNTFSLELAISFLYYLPFVAIPVLLNQRHAPQMLRLNPISVGDALRICVMAVLCMLIALFGITVWSGVLEAIGLDIYSETDTVPSNRSELMTYLVSAAVLAPICEEILFRGAVLSAWETRGTKKAVWITAILFATLHGSVSGFPAHLMMGVMLALSVVYTDSLYASLIFHTVYNASLTLVSYYVAQMPVTAEEEATAGMTVFASLGTEGLTSVVLNVAIYGLILYFMMRNLKRRHEMRRMLEAHAGETIQMANPAELKNALKAYSPMHAQTDSRPLRTSTILVLMAGAASAVVMYIINILSML